MLLLFGGGKGSQILNWLLTNDIFSMTCFLHSSGMYLFQMFHPNLYLNPQEYQIVQPIGEIYHRHQMSHIQSKTVSVNHKEYHLSIFLLDLIKLPVNIELNYRESVDLDSYYSFAANKYPGFAWTKSVYVSESHLSSL